MKISYWIFVIFSFSLFCSACNKENEDDLEVKKYDFSGIYISVDQDGKPGYLRSLDGSFVIRPSHGVCQIGSKDYYGHSRIETYSPNPQPFIIYKNDNKYISIPAGQKAKFQVGAIKAVDNDLYSFAYNTLGEGPAVYKNEIFLYNLEYSDGETWRVGIPTCITSDGKDIYVGGSILELGASHSIFHAAIWKNGKLYQILTDGGDYDSCKGITIYDGHIYACGRDEDALAIWKDGQKMTLSSEFEDCDGYLLDIYIYKGDIFACGYHQVPRGRMVAYDGVVLKNGALYQQITPADPYSIGLNSIVADNTGVYTGGIVMSTTITKTEKETVYEYTIKGAAWKCPDATPFFETETYPWHNFMLSDFSDFNVWLLKP